uniref:Transmembrane protein 68-like n=1 Tax=Phallusia mammillata TaxID=59560 RepID=A0A6F9DUJ8_9ASCI|nr:transmembrane protein 68-like [Phallusia mammillata]
MLYIVSHWFAAVLEVALDYVDYYQNIVFEWLDYYFPGWRIYLLSPFVILFFVLPMLLVVYLYLSALLLFVYHRRHSIYEAFHNHNVWEGYKQTIATFWTGHGRIWHGYEVVGMSNIPVTGSALIIYYHGAFPIDLYYLVAHIYLERGRVVRNVMDEFALKIPGLSRFFRFWGSFPGPRSKVVEYLKSGEMVSIAPGGLREALFSEDYSLVWENRVGFAKAALEAQVPILPMFTENCRQAFDNIKTGRKLFRRIYEKTRLPPVPIYGGFPVKLRTYVGTPIPYDSSLTPIALAKKVEMALQAMIQTYQEKPATIWGGLKQRIFSKTLPPEPKQLQNGKKD